MVRTLEKILFLMFPQDCCWLAAKLCKKEYRKAEMCKQLLYQLIVLWFSCRVSPQTRFWLVARLARADAKQELEGIEKLAREKAAMTMNDGMSLLQS